MSELLQHTVCYTKHSFSNFEPKDPVLEMIYKLCPLFGLTFEQTDGTGICSVIGYHNSTALACPIVQIKTNQICFTFGYNFDHWTVSYQGPEFNSELMSCLTYNGLEHTGHPDISYIIPKELVFKNISKTNTSKFTVEIGNKFNLYMFVWLLTKQLKLH